MDWIECQACWAEFKIISDVDSTLSYCPYCGEPIDLPIEDDEDLLEDE